MDVPSDCFDTCNSKLSFGQAILLAEQTSYIHVYVQQSMDCIKSSLFGTIGPLERGTYVAVPLPLANLLAEERIAIPQVPPWLSEEELRRLVKLELQSENLCPCPHPQYVEIAHIFFNSCRNPWAAEDNPYRTRENVLRLFEDLIAIRRAKIGKYNNLLIKNGAAITTALSNFERRRLGTLGLDYMKKLTSKPVACTEGLEDLLASMNVLDAEAHFILLEKAQEVCNAALTSDEDDE